MKQREGMKTTISDNEKGFSLLSWAFKIINGYPKDSINNQEETNLQDEVDEIIDENQDIDSQKDINIETEKIETSNNYGKI